MTEEIKMANFDEINVGDSASVSKTITDSDVMKFAEGSCTIEIGNTKVICTASVEEKVPIFLRNSGSGWVTAEYGMLPHSCKTRIQRESSRGKQSGRTQEIQRLIGRSLRSVVELDSLGERTVWIDCDQWMILKVHIIIGMPIVAFTVIFITGICRGVKY